MVGVDAIAGVSARPKAVARALARAPRLGSTLVPVVGLGEEDRRSDLLAGGARRCAARPATGSWRRVGDTRRVRATSWSSAARPSIVVDGSRELVGACRLRGALLGARRGARACDAGRVGATVRRRTMARAAPASIAKPAGRAPETADAWHGRDLDEAVETSARDVRQSTGLDRRERPRARLSEHGPNELEASPADRAVAAAASQQFRNVLILILLVAVGLSAALGHATEAIVIAVIVALRGACSASSRSTGPSARIEALQELAAPTATVVRDGKETEVPARELVPGDVDACSRPGDRVSADARLARGHSLQVEEAALTGESLPVEKQTEPLADDDAARRRPTQHGLRRDRPSTYGRGRALVVAHRAWTTEFGGIARMLQTIERAKTPLQQSLDRVGDAARARGASSLVASSSASACSRGEPFLDMLLFGMALAVAVVPEACRR